MFLTFWDFQLGFEKEKKKNEQKRKLMANGKLQAQWNENYFVSNVLNQKNNYCLLNLFLFYRLLIF